jgi:hypothetical protein
MSLPFSVRDRPTHSVEHIIETAKWLTTAKFCSLDPTRLAATKLEFQKMLDLGIICHSSSAWSSPLHMVRKKESDWLPCCCLNVCTTEDKYPLPNMGDLSARLDGFTFFSKLDLQKGYYQVQVAVADILKMAIIMPFGLFEFLRMPFGF